MDDADKRRIWRACLFVVGSFFLLGDFLVDVEDPRDVELHAVEVISNHSPQFVQTWVTGLCNLRGGRVRGGKSIHFLF